MSDTVGADLLGLAAQIAAAHVGRNEVAGEALPSPIQTVYRPLAAAGKIRAAPAVQEPAVSIRKS